MPELNGKPFPLSAGDRGTIRLMADDVVSVAFDDDGKTQGPAWTNPGWIGFLICPGRVRGSLLRGNA